MCIRDRKLEELTLKIEDVETLLDDVSEAAYDKAVEVVTDTVRQETHKEYILSLIHIWQALSEPCSDHPALGR